MKVMVPVIDDKTRKAEVAEGFHNLAYVCIFDSTTQKSEWLKSHELSETPGGLNEALLDRGVFSVISLNMTPMVLSLFNRNGIKVLKACGNDLDENIRLFQLSSLQVFTAEESRIQQSCNTQSCSTCGSTCK